MSVFILSNRLGNFLHRRVVQPFEPLDSISPDFLFPARQVEVLLHLNQLLGSPLSLLLLQLYHIFKPIVQIVNFLLKDILHHLLFFKLNRFFYQFLQLPHWLSNSHLLSCYA